MFAPSETRLLFSLPRNPRIEILVFGGAALIWLGLIYGPAALIPSCFHDDYYWFVFPHSQLWVPNRHPQYDFFNLCGRPLFNFFNYSEMLFSAWPKGFAHRLALVLIRLHCIVLIAIFATAVFGFMRSRQAPVGAAAVLALLLPTLPGFQLFLVWLVDIPPLISTLFGLFAGIACDTGARAFWSGRHLRGWVLTGVSLILALIALFTYQTGAMFFLLPILLSTIWTVEPLLPKLKVFLWSLSGFALASITYYAAARLVYLPLLLGARPDLRAGYRQMGSYQLQAHSLSLGTLWRILTKFLSPASSLWDLGGQGWGRWGIEAVLLASAAWAALRCLRGTMAPGKAVSLVFLSLLLTLGALLPFLVSLTDYAPFRSVLICSVILLSAAFAALHFLLSPSAEGSWSGPRRACAAGVYALLLLVGGASALQNATYCNLSNYLELQNIHTRMAEAIRRYGYLPHVYFIIPHGHFSLLDKPSYNDEFNVKSTLFPQDVPFIFQAAMAPFTDWRRHEQISVTETWPPTPGPHPLPDIEFSRHDSCQDLPQNVPICVIDPDSWSKR